MTDKPVNPYLTMPEDVLKVHIEQLSQVVGEKKIDVSQMFGASISEGDQDKIDQFDTLTSQVEDLTSKVNSASLSDVEIKLSQANLDRVVGDIKSLDNDAPIASIISSKFNNLDKLDILTNAKEMVEHYSTQIEAIKKEIGTDSTKADQTFSKPESTDSAASIIAELYNIKSE